MRCVAFAMSCLFSLAHAVDGDVDPTFGANGHVVLAPADASLSAYAVAIEGDDRILIGGTRWVFTAEGMPNQAVVWRLLANGTPDPSFGTSGIAVIPTPPPPGTLPAIWSIVPLHDGSVLAAGNIGGFGVAHLLADGNIDPAFGIGGVATIAFDDLGVEAATAFAAARDNTGRILLAGGGHANGNNNWGVGVIARLYASGAIDADFGIGGRVVFESGDATTPLSTALLGISNDASDRVWLSGRTQIVPSSANYSALAARLVANGTLDNTFGTGGVVTTNRYAGSDDNTGAAVLRNGHLTIGGICDPYGSPDPALCLLRIDADGHIDTAFGINGWASASLGQTLAWRNSAIACGDDDRCVLLGTANDPSTSVRQFVVLRIAADGTPDQGFGDAGLAHLSVPAGVDGTHVSARAIALQDGRPVAVGTTDGIPYVSALYATRLEASRIFGDGFDQVP